MSKKKKQNILTIAAIVVMLAVAIGVIIAFKGLPQIEFDEGSEERKEQSLEAQETILGEWIDPDDENFVIDIWRDGKGLFHAIINKNEEENQVTFWEMSGVWQDFENGFFYSDCKKSIWTYDGENRTEEVIYTDGSGSLSGDENGVIWDDKEEKAGKGITFIYTGDY